MSKRLCSEPVPLPEESGPEPRGIEGLMQDISVFSETSTLPSGLFRHVGASQEAQARWYKEMSNTLKDNTPQTPEDATKFVYDVFCKVYPKCFSVFDLEDVLFFYGLPAYNILPEMQTAIENTLAELNQRMSNPISKYKPPVKANKPVVDFPEFQLITLPVTMDQVTEGGGLTVFVEVAYPYALPSKILLLLNELHKALAKEEVSQASEARNKINTTEDYKMMQSINGVEVLTRKYDIRLRDTCVPGVETSARRRKTREELARMVDGKCLTIDVFCLDANKRYVGDVYCDGSFLQGSLLKKVSGWTLAEPEEDDAQLKKEQAKKSNEELLAMESADDFPDSVWNIGIGSDIGSWG